jgi:hypothetical protein
LQESGMNEAERVFEYVSNKVHYVLSNL